MSKLNLTNESTNYSATIVKIYNLVDLPGRDRVKGFPCQGFQAIVPISYSVGELGVFFTVECQLSPDYCFNNNLYRKGESLNKDEEKFGFFESSGRVKAIKFAGHKSNALFMPLSSLSYLGIDINELKEGDSFTHINGAEICRKYVIKTQQTKNNKVKGLTKKFTRIEAKLFPEHFDTDMYFRNIHHYKDNDYIYVTAKLHGCVEANTLIETDLGNKTIKEIVDSKLECKIKAFNILTNQIVFVPIDDYYFKANDGDWYEIELEDGSKITITGNNPVWLPELNNYVKVENLKENDSFLIDKSHG